MLIKRKYIQEFEFKIKDGQPDIMVFSSYQQFLKSVLHKIICIYPYHMQHIYIEISFVWSILCFWKIKLGNVCISDIEYFAQGSIWRTKFVLPCRFMQMDPNVGFLILWCYYLQFNPNVSHIKKWLSANKSQQLAIIPLGGKLIIKRGNYIIHLFLKFYTPFEIYMYFPYALCNDPCVTCLDICIAHIRHIYFTYLLDNNTDNRNNFMKHSALSHACWFDDPDNIAARHQPIQISSYGIYFQISNTLTENCLHRAKENNV